MGHLQCGIALGSQGHARHGMNDGQEAIKGHQHQGVNTASKKSGTGLYVGYISIYVSVYKGRTTTHLQWHVTTIMYWTNLHHTLPNGHSGST